MLEISESIKKLDDSDIADNLLHYDYNSKHLLSLIEKNVDKEDPLFLSSYRSFEGEVFENFIYEKLLRYAETNDEIEKFILKGYHQSKDKAYANTLSISEKQQIVYRTKNREISEFDAMFFTKTELYFVEMTLVKSIIKLKKRLRKKKALLEILFPNHEIKALIVLNEGATGVKQLPDYCTTWLTDEFSAQHVLKYIQDIKTPKDLQKKDIIRSKKMVEAHTLKLHPFRYYNTLTWITKSLRKHKRHILDLKFLYQENVQRYHDLYNKFYIGYMDLHDAKEMLNLEQHYEKGQRVVVAIEKKHTDEIILTYYIQKSRKNLSLYSFDDDEKLSVVKKDPYGITVTEVYHVNKVMDESYKLSMGNIYTIKKLLRQRFLSIK